MTPASLPRKVQFTNMSLSVKISESKKKKNREPVAAPRIPVFQSHAFTIFAAADSATPPFTYYISNTQLIPVVP